MNKKKELVIIFSLFLIGFIAFVTSATTFVSPVAGGNYSRTFLLNISADANGLYNMTNITCYYNSSGGTATTVLTQILNESASDLIFNKTINISSLTDSLYYNISCSVYNSTSLNKTISIKNITFDSTTPAVSFSGITNAVNNGNYSGSLLINVSVTDATIGMGFVYFNITNSTGTQVNFTKASTVSGGYYNISIDTTTFSDGVYNVTVFANDTQLNNLNNTERITITIDNTIPVASFSCSPTIVTTSDSVSCICTPTDSLSGVNLSTISYTQNPSVATVGDFTLNCSFKDFTGNWGSQITSYTVNPHYSSFAPGSGGVSTPSKVNSWSKITPGVAAIIKDFNIEGIKQIQIEVSSEAKDVKITVNKYDTKPANVSIEKTGTYKYLHIVTVNLADKLSKAVMTIEVNKSWLSGKGLSKLDVSLYKYDESSKKWNELTTTFKEEDTVYNYYNVELNSFSYFAIAPKQTTAAVNEEEQTATEEQEPITTSSSGNYLWWIIGGVVLLALILAGSKLFKKKRRK